jgi:hypothetical protein
MVERESRGHPERNLGAEVRFLSSMLRRAQIRIGARPLSEWLRGENRFEAKRGIAPNQHQEMRKTNRTLLKMARCWCALFSPERIAAPPRMGNR